MFIYIDETGCPGMKIKDGASPFFTLTAIVFPDQEQARHARKAIIDLREAQSLHPHFEFRYNKMAKKLRLAFFDAIQPLDFKYHSFTLNKAGLVDGALDDPKKLYRSVTRWTIENILDTLRKPNAPTHASLIFDSCGDRQFYDVVERFAQNYARWKLGNLATLRVLAVDSKAEDLLQVADVVCGAIGGYRKGCPKGTAYLSTIHSKRATFRKWPQ